MQQIPLTQEQIIRRRIKLGMRAFDFIMLAGFVFLIIFSIINKDYLQGLVFKQVYDYGLVALFILNFFFELVPQAISPYFTIIPSLAFGLEIIPVISVIIAGSLLGAWVGYEIGKKWGEDLLRVLFKPSQVKKATRFIDKYGNAAVFLAAISPLPYIPIIFGALEMKRKDFVIWGLGGRFLGLLVGGYLSFLGKGYFW
jgi:membrane protein DedA with SNARE-associated domain